MSKQYYNSELYYAEMEAARNTAAAAYFSARPHLDNQAGRDMFDAGFERAFKSLWRAPSSQETRTDEAQQ